MGAVTAALLTALVLHQVPTAPSTNAATAGPAAPTIITSLRPQHVRVGGRVVLTVRVDYEGEVPEEIQLVHAPEVEVVDIIDRRRIGQWERDFIVTPTAVSGGPTPQLLGESSEPLPAGWVVEVEVAGLVFDFDVNPPTVESAGDWAVREPEEETVAPMNRPGASAILPGATPTGAGGSIRGPGTLFPSPGVGAPLRGGQVGQPGGAFMPGMLGPTSFAQPARQPIPGGWAERAHLDPWWPEIVPELFGYDAAVEDGRLGMTIEAGVTPTTAYVGQQLSVFTTFSYRPEQARARPWFVPADLAEFSRVKVGAASMPTARDGDLEHSLTFQTAYFPTAAGEWSIPSGRVMFAGPGFLGGPSVPVMVLPVPTEAAPPGYRGAVGRFEIAATLEPQAVVWGQPARLRVEVRGVGDVRSLPPPVLPPVSGATLTPFRNMAWPELQDGVVGGLRVFEYLVSPVDLGPVDIAPIVFSYFDPYVGDFGLAATEELRLEVVR